MDELDHCHTGQTGYGRDPLHQAARRLHAGTLPLDHQHDPASRSGMGMDSLPGDALLHAVLHEDRSVATQPDGAGYTRWPEDMADRGYSPGELLGFRHRILAQAWCRRP